MNIPIGVLRRPENEISLRAKVVFGVVLMHCGRRGTARISRKSLLRETGFSSMSTLDRAIAEAEKGYLIHVTHREYSQDEKGVNLYRVIACDECFEDSLQ